MIGNKLELHDLSDTRLIGQVSAVHQVTDLQRSQMFNLMQAHYENVRRDEFEADFAQKDSVILALDARSGHVRGFSTQVSCLQYVDGRPIRILFSGDTIVDRRYWAKNPLSQLWGQTALSLIDANRDHPLYWFLISKGYKTYRFLPVFFHEFFPRYDIKTPAFINRLISHVAVTRFGKRYDAQTGIIKASPGGCRLREAIADITPARAKDRHVAFFDRANPGHANGDELCCLAPLTRENFNRKAYRVIGDPQAAMVRS